MAIDKRTPASVTKQFGIGNGPFLARIVGHLDPSYMGSLQVSLLRPQGNQQGEDTQVYIVKCASPFYGYTAFEFMGNNTADKSTTHDGYNDTQKSYGMWMVPPDVGVTVLVTFVNGDPGQGYWIGCVPSNFANNMVPAIAGAPNSTVAMDKKDKAKYNTSADLPVAEINRRINSDMSGIDPRKMKKPLHPIAEHFLEEGLVEDGVRGVTTSSARREVPSMVFGISTPGPLDRRIGAKKGKIGTKNHQVNRWISRLGGSQFVMDDGDDRYQRAETADIAPPVYYESKLKQVPGQDIIPKDELIRLRTRTGHQILMHNSEDLIYISNSRGTAWIEMSSDGKIDIYARDSISMHSQNDINFRADRDVNIEAGRNINIKATAEYKSPNNLFAGPANKDAIGNEAGRIQIESAYNFNLLIGANGKIHLPNDVTGNLHVNVKCNTKITSGNNIDIDSGGHHYETSVGNNETLAAGNIIESGSTIQMNGPTAATATKAETVSKLPLHYNDITEQDLEWAVTKYQEQQKLASIMKRVPMHEPWAPKENLNPLNLKPKDTDREV